MNRWPISAADNPQDGLPDEGLDEALGRVVDEWDRLKIEEAEAKAAAEQRTIPSH
jgi:hypothetical protein